jgi:hypothetical protein
LSQSRGLQAGIRVTLLSNVAPLIGWRCGKGAGAEFGVKKLRYEMWTALDGVRPSTRQTKITSKNPTCACRRIFPQANPERWIGGMETGREGEPSLNSPGPVCLRPPPIANGSHSVSNSQFKAILNGDLGKIRNRRLMRAVVASANPITPKSDSQ